jgi:hypothetical protein
MLELRDGTRKSDEHQLFTRNLHKTNTRWLVHNWSTFGVRMSHRQIRIHKTHHGPDLGEATTFPLIVYSMLFHEAHIQMAFCPGTPKWKSRNCQSRTTRNFVFCNLSYATKKSHMQLFWSCMQHVQLHATFFSCIRQVTKDKISISVGTPTTLGPHNFMCRPPIKMKSEAKL